MGKEPTTEEKLGKRLSYDRVISKTFFAMLTIIAGFISYTLNDINHNISQLNLQMVTVLERQAGAQQVTTDLKTRVDDHEVRIRAIEKAVK